MYMKRRKSKGSAVAFGAALALALVILGVGFLIFSLYMGGQSETKNATDAGALSLGRDVQDQIQVQLSQDENQQCFNDVTTDSTDNSANPDGNVDLRRINRVWAKALLMAINADAAQNDGNVGSGESNAQQACSGAQAISDSLAQKLDTPSNLYGFFDAFSQQNSVRMIEKGLSVSKQAGSNWQTSLLDRNDESNIVLNGQPPSFNLPPNYSLSSDAYTKCTRTNVPTSAANFYFLKGYAPITAAGQTFWQVPYQYDEKPHLVSRTIFDANTAKASPISWDNPVPNSFSVFGAANKPGGKGENAMSWVLTNPNQPFQLSMPHGFLHIHVDDMYTHWYYFPTGYPPIEFGPTQQYGYTTDDQTSTGMPEGGPFCSYVIPVDVTVGLDVVGRSLDDIIFGVPTGDTSGVEAYMTNRINEMISVPGKTLTASDLHSVLGQFQTRGWLVAGQTDFYLYSNDGKTISLAPQLTAQAFPLWLASEINNTPDGSETKLIDDATSPSLIYDVTATPDPFCTFVFAMGETTWDKDVYWTPGTGYNNCLGQIRVKRWTDCYSVGICAPD